MANIGVNVPVPEVIDYMGSLYAENTVLGDWMLDVDRLKVALLRAWIFQEMSFGRLDKEAMSVLFERLRERGRAVSQIPMVNCQSVSAFSIAARIFSFLIFRVLVTLK